MEQLQSSRPWRNKINGSSIKERSDYTDVFSVPPWRTEPFSVRLDDYSEIFDATAFASIPVLELSVVEQGFETVDYLNVFGNGSSGGFATSCEEIFAESKISAGSSSVGRNRWDVLSERRGKEASEHPLKVYTANKEPNLEMKQYTSFPRQPDDINSKKFSMPYHRMRQETIDNDSKNKAFKNGIVNNMDSNGNSPDGGQKNQKQIFVSNPPESNFGSLLDVPVDQKPNSQTHSSHSASSDRMLLHDVVYLKVSEINLQTKPFKGPPPSRPPPTLSMKPEHLKIMSANPKVDVEEGISLNSNVNNQLHSCNEVAKTHRSEESIEGISFSHDAKMDHSSAAAVSIAAIKEAIEQAQVRLMSAKKLMDRKCAKSDQKVGLPKAMSEMEDGTAYEVTLRNCSTGIVANNLLNTNGDCEGKEIRTGVRIHLNHEERKMQLSSHKKDQQQQVSKGNTFKSSVEREEIRNTSSKIGKKDEQVRKENASKSSELTCKIADVAGKWKIDEEYYELPRNDRFFNTVKDIYIQGDEEKPKVVICSSENKENYGNDSEHVVELEHQQKSMEVSVCTEKFAKDNNLKIPCIDGVEEDTINLADAAMDEFLHKDYASELEEDYGSPLSDENQKQSEAHEDKDIGNNANKLNYVAVCSLYEENINEVGYNIFFEPWVANVNREEKDLQATERKLNVSHGKFEVNESNKEVKVQNKTFIHDMFKNEIKESDELFTFNTGVEKELDDEIKLPNHENETRSMTDQASCSAYKFEIEKGDNAVEKHERDEFQTNEEVQILVENHIEQEAIQNENRLENGLEMPEVQGRVKDAELEKILNSTEETCRKDCNEKESREFRTSLQKDDELVLPLINQDVKFTASAEGVSGNRVSEHITKLNVLAETQISSNSADEACQLGEIEESDTGKIFLSGKEGSLRATVPGATENSHDEKARNYKHSLYTEAEGNKSKRNVDRERNGELEIHLEQKDLKREKEREMIAAERENYEACQQELSEARARTERIAVERATTEARERALEEARQKAEKAAEVEKAFREARLRAERAAVERVTEEARKRAIEKVLAEKTAADARERTTQVGTSKGRLRNDNRTEHFKATRTMEDFAPKYKPTLAKDQWSAQSQTATSSATVHIYSESHSNVGEAESKLSKARQQKQQQTVVRAAKALNERNMRDILMQREQAERDRLAESLDGDVRRWSSGKDGNLCILLSTLEYILGPDSGWQPISLKDIMNASAAKKAYRKATLCVHPDKLQQRGASIQQKYICEKVFDLLQEAWNKFNSEER